MLLQVEGADNESPAVTEAHGGNDIDVEHDNRIYENIIIPNKGWENRLQDVGCTKQ